MTHRPFARLTTAATVSGLGPDKVPLSWLLPAPDLQAIRAALLPEDVARFHQDFRAIMAEATESMSLSGVSRVRGTMAPGGLVLARSGRTLAS